MLCPRVGHPRDVNEKCQPEREVGRSLEPGDERQTGGKQAVGADMSRAHFSNFNGPTNHLGILLAI